MKARKLETRIIPNDGIVAAPYLGLPLRDEDVILNADANVP